MKLPVLALSATFVLIGCGSSSPDNFVETSARIGCRYVKKCEEDEWKEAKFDSVSDCVDQFLDEKIPDFAGGETTARELFVSNCKDFDSSAARQCLSASRQAVRQCDPEAAPRDKREACAEVCGNPVASQLFTDPGNRELALELLEQLEAEGELD